MQNSRIIKHVPLRERKNLREIESKEETQKEQRTLKIKQRTRNPKMTLSWMTQVLRIVNVNTKKTQTRKYSEMSLTI